MECKYLSLLFPFPCDHKTVFTEMVQISSNLFPRICNKILFIQIIPPPLICLIPSCFWTLVRINLNVGRLLSL